MPFKKKNNRHAWTHHWPRARLEREGEREQVRLIKSSDRRTVCAVVGVACSSIIGAEDPGNLSSVLD